MRRRGIGRPAQPSLVNTAARTAVVVGTAERGQRKGGVEPGGQGAAVGACHRRTTQPPPDATSAPAPAAPSQPALSDDVYDQLKKLGELREAGILTDDEFQAKKTQILGL